jgi:two-component system LytT family response regulator
VTRERPGDAPMRVTTYVVDDEPVARAGLRAMLAAFDWITIVGEAADGESARQGIEALRPELVFLDVQMPELLGTEVLQRLTWRPYVIFTTAYSEHAVTAFELGAVDYLLKPFGPPRLAAAMQRAQAAFGEPAPADALDRLSGALGGGPIQRLFVRVGGALALLPVERVSRFEADGDYVVAHAEDARHLLHLSLARLEERLDPVRFTRVHRAHLVNLEQVRAFRSDERGNLEAIMRDGARVPVSRSRAKEIRSLGR